MNKPYVVSRDSILKIFNVVCRTISPPKLKQHRQGVCNPLQNKAVKPRSKEIERLIGGKFINHRPSLASSKKGCWRNKERKPDCSPKIITLSFFPCFRFSFWFLFFLYSLSLFKHFNFFSRFARRSATREPFSLDCFAWRDGITITLTRHCHSIDDLLAITVRLAETAGCKKQQQKGLNNNKKTCQKKHEKFILRQWFKMIREKRWW